MLKKILLILFFIPALASAQDFIEGKDYQAITSSKIDHTKNKTPIVTEFFSFGCPWCYKLESPLNQWKVTVGNAVQLEKIPVVFKPSWDLYAKAYYTSKTLALSDKLTPALFKAIQEDNHPLDTKQSMIDFFVAHGVDREIAKSAFASSPSIDMQVSDGMAKMAEFQINAVPAFVINNQFKTDLQMAGNPERLFEIINYLLKK